MRFSAILITQNDGKYCFIWSFLAHLRAKADFENGHATRGSFYRH